jgi:hypothetical protein
MADVWRSRIALLVLLLPLPLLLLSQLLAGLARVTPSMLSGIPDRASLLSNFISSMTTVLTQRAPAQLQVRARRATNARLVLHRLRLRCPGAHSLPPTTCRAALARLRTQAALLDFQADKPQAFLFVDDGEAREGRSRASPCCLHTTPHPRARRLICALCPLHIV